MTRYRTIVADPPWTIYEAVPRWGASTGSVQRPYDVMSLDAISALPVKDWAARRAHLYLWTINEYLEDSFGVARAWGFEPSITLTWCKSRSTGIGGTFSSDTEFVVFCSRDVGAEDRADLGAWLRAQREAAGLRQKDVAAHWPSKTGGLTGCVANWELGLNAPTLDQWARLKTIVGFPDDRDAEIRRINDEKGTLLALDRAPGRWFTWPVAEHSRKPEAFMDLVEQVSPEPRLEMFSRRARFGWDTWGNESLHGGEAALAQTCLDCGQRSVVAHGAAYRCYTCGADEPRREPVA